MSKGLIVPEIFEPPKTGSIASRKRKLHDSEGTSSKDVMNAALNQAWQKPGFYVKKIDPVGFLINPGFYWVFWVIYKNMG